MNLPNLDHLKLIIPGNRHLLVPSACIPMKPLKVRGGRQQISTALNLQSALAMQLRLLRPGEARWGI